MALVCNFGTFHLHEQSVLAVFGTALAGHTTGRSTQSLASLLPGTETGFLSPEHGTETGFLSAVQDV
eukprot:3920489-Rhodomonas_salina.2